ncbi:magnesium transporter CorA family protein [Paenibacillus sp. GCM10023252]|uniref:magnesium transporter CorA family protein n=1 Tax=Paenibacillus sp. GCM10023252 TaxID=3252649 RepID=UPI003609EEDA
MVHRMLRYPAGWEWHLLMDRQQSSQAELPRRVQATAREFEDHVRKQVQQVEDQQAERKEQRLAMKRLLPECALWMDACEGRTSNQITVAQQQGGQSVLYGTLMYQGSEQLTDIQPFHFWLSPSRLVTMHEDLRLTIQLQNDEHTDKLQRCGSAPEALFIILGAMLDVFHQGLDGFETRLGELETTMRVRNRTGLMDDIFERRYDLLHWSHLFLPVREVHGAAKEAFLEGLTGSESFERISHKLERIEELLKHYALEIDTLISMDDAIANFRGNDIMKTLTIFTALFTPATVVGALWGMNYKVLPWAQEPWGFPFMCGIVIIFTSGIYAWLWKKGWTGDLLIGHKKQRKRRPTVSGSPSARSSSDEQAGTSPAAAAQGLSRSSRGSSKQTARRNDGMRKLQ